MTELNKGDKPAEATKELILKEATKIAKGYSA
jgi:hypothetical protein